MSTLVKRFVVSSCLLLVGACSYDIDAHPGACRARDQCPNGAECYRGFCISEAVVQDAATAECEDGAPPQDCYDGPLGTEALGVCRAGQRFCVRGELTDCFDQVTPAVETCNGRDDDCNGEVDDVEPRSCKVAIAQRCTLDGTVVCRSGAPSCELASSVGPESCNAVDDHCDGLTTVSKACFPEGESGCTADSQGGFSCLGVCTPGRVSCADESSQCAGALGATAETCTQSGPSLDEDCDGRLDEGCACEQGATRACYTGPAATLGQGPCKEGTQTCDAGTWSACSNVVVPRAESCANPGVDDDCDGVMDDIAGLGDACTDSAKLGVCRSGTLLCQPGQSALVCVGALPSAELCDALDQDCDGNPVNTFDLNSEAHCGSCDVSCAATEICCGGQCMQREHLETDPQHCGDCDRACGSNQYCCQGTCLDQRIDPVASGPQAGADLTACNCPMDCGAKACCGTRCVDLIKDPHNCGACGYVCSEHQECKGGTCKDKP